MKIKATRKISSVLTAFLLLSAVSCAKKPSAKDGGYRETVSELTEILKRENLSEEARYALVNKIATTLLAKEKYTELAVYLTDWIENHPDDKFNAYWLLMVAQSYLTVNAGPMAEFYLERIVKNYPDLEVKGQSVHFLCLEKLIEISRNSDSRIKYFHQLINRFPANVSITEMYMRLAREYELTGEWANALKMYEVFLDQPDATTIHISDIPDAYNYAKTLIDFNNSPKNWMFPTLSELENAIRTAIDHYQPRRLDTYRSKVNFFAVSWQQNETSSKTGQVDFSMSNYMTGNRITCDKGLIPGPTANEAYLRTKGWRTVPVWNFYFREVNFPADPDIHGTWEWAGIYIGDML